MEYRVIADSDDECEPSSPVLSPAKAPSQPESHTTIDTTTTNTVSTEALQREIQRVQQNLGVTSERTTKRRRSSNPLQYTPPQAAPKRRKTAQAQSTIGIGGSSSGSARIQLSTLEVQQSERYGKAGCQTSVSNELVPYPDDGSWSLPATIQNEFNHLLPEPMFSEASSTIPDDSLTRQGLFGSRLSIDSPRVVGEPGLGSIATEGNTSSLEWSSIPTNLTEKSHSNVGNDGSSNPHLVIRDEQERHTSTEAPTKDTHSPQGSPQKLAEIPRDTRSSSGVMGPPITPPNIARTRSLKLPAETAPGAQGASKGTRKPRRSASMASPVQASSKAGKGVKTAAVDTGLENETPTEPAEAVPAVLSEQKKLRQGRSVSLQHNASRSADDEACHVLPPLTGKGDTKGSTDTDPNSKDTDFVQLKEKPQHRPSRSRSMQVPASSSVKKKSASKRKLSLLETLNGTSAVATLKKVDGANPESSKVDPLAILHSNNVCVEIPVIEPMEDAKTPNDEKQEQKLRRQNSINPPLVEDQSSMNHNEGKDSIHIHEDEDIPIELPKKKGRGRPKKSTVIPAEPPHVEHDTNVESEITAETKVSEGVSHRVLREMDANCVTSLPDTAEESLLEVTSNEAPPLDKTTPGPQTPQKVQNLKSSTGIPSLSERKVKHRVGLSRKARCPPLLKMVKK